jgi:hypothetical protein
LVGRGSAPSDPRLSYHIGNPGIRKQAKIRKMAKPESSHLNTDRRRGSFNPAWNPGWKSKQMACRRTVVPAIPIKAWPLVAGPPCSSA